MTEETPARTENIYEDVNRQEIARLEEMSPYPDKVVISLVKDEIKPGNTFLDAGAGPSVGLWKFVEAAGGKYFPFDLSLKNIKAQIAKYGKDTILEMDKPFVTRSVQANILNFPYLDESADFVNMRFVLAHTPPTDWPQAIRETVRVAGHEALISEHDWNTLKSDTNPKLINDFKEACLEFAELMHIDSFAGASIYSEIKKTLSEDSSVEITEHRKPRPEENYTKELLSLASSVKAISEERGLTELAKRFEEFIEQFKEQPVKFVPPDIVVVRVVKK